MLSVCLKIVLYKNKYKTDSSRLKDWDYSSPGYYFVTICTKDRINYFGEVINDEISLSTRLISGLVKISLEFLMSIIGPKT